MASGLGAPLLLAVWAALEVAGFLEVEMAGKTQVVFLNDDVTIYCKIPGSPLLDSSIMGVMWFRKIQGSAMEARLFEYYGDHQAAFRPGASVPLELLERGDASLRLPAIQLREAGEYRCEVVVTPQKAEGVIQVEVVASPAGKVTLDQAPTKENRYVRVVCKSAGFYPESINVTWEKWTQKAPQHLQISEGIFTGPPVKNEDGTFNVTSYLMLKSPVEADGAIYQCVVGHISLHTSQRFSLPAIETAESATGNVFGNNFYSILVATAVIGLIF
ncbi:natural cytotoxicity triggering receptor 3 ligand 1-like isoform X1 [Lepus europaeus]|uniref:natural cytotoxicity triggering receptor 3 ligand 1-like isoform X1 n=1 Tax=Lepus europaeus TaxID=9983 RepID=UPI002B49F3F5|nr:natural cytotoxicity triggering receptor 3 ligand 1-like isoform X1 [Lepus europaeus]